MLRHDKVTEALKREVSIIVHDELKDPRLGFVTITGAELTHDLRYAKIFFSVLGKEEDYQKTKEALDSALGFIRKLVAERINLRLAPEIAFKEDRSSEYGMKIEKILEEIKGLNPPEKPQRKTKAPKTKKKGKKREPVKSRRVHKKK